MGPLAGIKVIEMKGIGPCPYAGMLLADMGAEVVVVERSSRATGIGPPSEFDVCSRGKKSIALDLKTAAALEALLRMVEGADVIIEGFRPGVAERLGFGPDVCLARNPRIVFGRLTGWGQSGPLSPRAGHDINYIALTGALAAIGPAETPVPPLNLVGDYAGGSLFLVIGVLAALLEAGSSGRGQVVDAAITDGTTSLTSVIHTYLRLNEWSLVRESNLLDGGCPFYAVYETADERFVSVGALEPGFFEQLIRLLELPERVLAWQHDRARWPELRQSFTQVFRRKTREEWVQVFADSDACVAPVLDAVESADHPHNKARGTHVRIGGTLQPAPAPRFSRNPCSTPEAARAEGADTQEALTGWGFSEADIQGLRDAGALS